MDVGTLPSAQRTLAAPAVVLDGSDCHLPIPVARLEMEEACVRMSLSKEAQTCPLTCNRPRQRRETESFDLEFLAQGDFRGDKSLDSCAMSSSRMMALAAANCRRTLPT